MLRLDAPVDSLLERRLLEGLFVQDGIDHSRRATAEQLLAHTSGVADYFSGPVLKGRKMIEIVLTGPDRSWKPLELLDFARANQKAVGVPGKRFNYSDTGYVLLGFIVETILGKPFGKALEEEIFDPLGMADTFLLFENGARSRPGVRLDKMHLRGIDASTMAGVSCDWAGGGVATATKDLLRFSRALRGGALLGGLLSAFGPTLPRTRRR